MTKTVFIQRLVFRMIFVVLFTFIFCDKICFAQMVDKAKQESKVKQENNIDAQDNKASEKYIRNVKSFLRKQKAEWNEDQIQCAALYWQTAEKVAKTRLDNDFILLFMGIVNKFDKPKTTKELAGEVVLRCTIKLQEVENIISILQPQYELQKTVSQIKSQSYPTTLMGDHARMQDAAADPKQYEKRRVINQLKEATIQQKRCTVYMNFAKKVQATFKLSE
jgi:hypothetical protein